VVGVTDFRKAMHMTSNNRKHQLEEESRTRRTTLEQLRTQLASATREYKSSRKDADGRSVSDFADRVRLAEMALDGVLEELDALNRPRRIEITDSRANLCRERDRVQQRLAYRRKEHDEQVEAERQRCGYRNPEWVKRHLANVFRGDPENVLRRSTAEDSTRLEAILAQIAELDRREGSSNSPEAA
jgi:hypothetical protein